MNLKNSEKYDKYIGKILDTRYKLVKYIGEGSSAVVFKADDLRTGRPVAVKVLKPEHAKDVKSVKRFENECRVISMLSDDNIVRMVEVSIGTYSKYIVMEYINGITMRNYMDKQGALSFEEIMHYCEQILYGLEHAHSKGIIHRDIKPQNIMLLPKGKIKITDFGIAQVNDEAGANLNDIPAGTAYYISPEQAAGGEVDARSDIYSLGVMMYEMATGKLPFDGPDAMAVAKKQITDKPIPPREINPKIPRGLEAMILMAMEKMPEARFKDAGEMLKYLGKINSRRDAVPRISEKRKKQQKIEKREKVRPSNSSTPIIWGVASALLCLAIIAGYYIFTNLLFADKTKMVSREVPDFVGTLYSENGMIYDEEYFTINKDKIIFQYDENTPANTIIEQNPAAGTFEKVIADTKKCEIVLTVSLGAKTYTIKDYSLMDVREAELDLKRMNFTVKIEQEYNPMVAAGLIINTVPGVGEKAVEGTEILLKVSTGFNKESVTVPNFVDMNEVEAQRIIEEKGMRVGKVTYTRSSVAVGTILIQSIEAESNFDYSNIVIDFTVSGGRNYDTNYIPDVSGMTRNAAITTLFRFGLVPKKITEVKSEIERNNVVSQSPASQSSFSPEITEVDLVLSGGPNYVPSMIVVVIPDVKGKTLNEARQILTGRKASLGNVTYEYNATIPEGQIISQGIEPNSNKSGYPYEVYVDVVISKGPAPYVPDTGTSESTTAPEEVTSVPEGSFTPQG